MLNERFESRGDSCAPRKAKARLVTAFLAVTTLLVIALPPRASAAVPDFANVVYAYTPRGEPLWMDLYLPKGLLGGLVGRLPVIVFIHGGGWSMGSKAEVPDFILNQGFIVAGINYRLTANNVGGNSTTADRWPAQIADVKAAIRYVRSLHGAPLGKAGSTSIDGNRIGVYGFSAGGHLAALLGTSADTALDDLVLQPPQSQSIATFRAISTRVKAVCDVAGPADLTWGNANALLNQGYMTDAQSGYAMLLGGPVIQNLAKATAASPITYASGDEPPFLIIHGALDTTVDPGQSTELDQILRSGGTKSTLRSVFGVHGNPPFYTETSVIVQFFKSTL